MARVFWVALTLVAACALTDAADSDDRPYKFQFNIEKHHHRLEEKNTKGLVKGEFGFVTGDGVYHETAYATDENGDFKILGMRSYFVGLRQNTLNVLLSSQSADAAAAAAAAAQSPFSRPPSAFGGPGAPSSGVVGSQQGQQGGKPAYTPIDDDHSNIKVGGFHPRGDEGAAVPLQLHPRLPRPPRGRRHGRPQAGRLPLQRPRRPGAPRGVHGQRVRLPAQHHAARAERTRDAARGDGEGPRVRPQGLRVRVVQRQGASQVPAGRAVRAARALCTVCQARAVSAVRAIRSARPVRAIRTACAVRTIRTACAVRADHAACADRSTRPVRAVRQARAVCAVRAIRSARTIRAIRSACSVRADRSARPDRADRAARAVCSPAQSCRPRSACSLFSQRSSCRPLSPPRSCRPCSACSLFSQRSSCRPLSPPRSCRPCSACSLFSQRSSCRPLSPPRSCRPCSACSLFSQRSTCRPLSLPRSCRPRFPQISCSNDCSGERRRLSSERVLFILLKWL
ncbi:hypothetical protein ONE63_006246 [Megalurothrips usitatus]|uniref:Protein lethal(3)malignant blood neoplasm 1 n=1 Tax=Megalurothrips usitatus TaxID=439358 RepID=A0AAV7XZQ6_9NEOP|nr:hypothetical protein ONE63_006246 [Megalurothrips usitatus]